MTTMRHWIIKEKEYFDTVEKIWDSCPHIQILLGANLFEKLMTDIANLTFKTEVPSWATHFYGGDKAFMSPAGNDQYEEIPK